MGKADGDTGNGEWELDGNRGESDEMVEQVGPERERVLSRVNICSDYYFFRALTSLPRSHPCIHPFTTCIAIHSIHSVYSNDPSPSCVMSGQQNKTTLLPVLINSRLKSTL